VSTYPGGFQLLNDPRETMGAALKYLGYSLNSTDLDALEEAAELIQGVKQHHRLRQLPVHRSSDQR
jgi:spermidine/putrescine-binding protein